MPFRPATKRIIQIYSEQHHFFWLAAWESTLKRLNNFSNFKQLIKHPKSKHLSTTILPWILYLSYWKSDLWTGNNLNAFVMSKRAISASGPSWECMFNAYQKEEYLTEQYFLSMKSFTLAPGDGIDGVLIYKSLPFLVQCLLVTTFRLSKGVVKWACYSVQCNFPWSSLNCFIF